MLICFPGLLRVRPKPQFPSDPLDARCFEIACDIAHGDVSTCVILFVVARIAVATIRMTPHGHLASEDVYLNPSVKSKLVGSLLPPMEEQRKEAGFGGSVLRRVVGILYFSICSFTLFLPVLYSIFYGCPGYI